MALMIQGIARSVSFMTPAQEKQRRVHISFFNEQGLMNDVLGTVRLTDIIMVKVGDESV